MNGNFQYSITRSYLYLILLTSTSSICNSFLPNSSNHHRHHATTTKDAFVPQKIGTNVKSSTAIFGGIGITSNYTWKEDQFEIEVKFPVPAETRSKHINYIPKSKSVFLSIDNVKIGDGDSDENDNTFSKTLLFDERKFRGMVDLDGTFWSLVDLDINRDDNAESNPSTKTGRELVLTIEKLIVPPSDPFAVVEYDWGSVYLDDEDEIISKRYDEPEELDIREYAKSLGVDIDNINMTMVDKSMFSSGLNMTRNTLDELTKAGYAQEVTRQSDGTESIVTDGKDGTREDVPFQSLGEGIGVDELQGLESMKPPPSSIPFLDTDSPWRKSMPVEEARGFGDDTGDANANTNAEDGSSVEEEPASTTTTTKHQDPVDKLTVVKLKEILRKEGLKVSGNKKDLQDRLRSHVSSVMDTKRQEKREGEEWQ